MPSTRQAPDGIEAVSNSPRGGSKLLGGDPNGKIDRPRLRPGVERNPYKQRIERAMRGFARRHGRKIVLRGEGVRRG